jgi:hypothetical protein
MKRNNRCYCRRERHRRWCNVIFCLVLVVDHLSRQRLDCVAVLVVTTDNVQQQHQQQQQQQQQDECLPGTEDSEQQLQQISEKKKKKECTLIDNDGSNQEEGEQDEGEACSIIACHQNYLPTTTPTVAVVGHHQQQLQQRPHHHRHRHHPHHPPLVTSLLERIQRSWEHFRVHILHLPSQSFSSRQQQTKQRYFNIPQQLFDQYYASSSEEAVMATQLQLSQESSGGISSSSNGDDSDDDVAQGRQPQRDGPRRVARIVRSPDYFNDDVDCLTALDASYHPPDDDDDNDDDGDDGLDSNDVFALENSSNNKCQVNMKIMEPHVGMILEVSSLPHANENDFDDDGGGGSDNKDKDIKNDKSNSNNKVRYQLTQPMDLELGTTVKHAADYAYIPVLSARVEPILVVTPQKEYEQEQTKHVAVDKDSENGQKQSSGSRSSGRRTKGTRNKSLVGAEDTRSPNEWWQWWIPWSTWRQQRKNDDDEGGGYHHHQERYRMKENKAFAGGSHGQVWRGTRRCDDHEDEMQSKANGPRTAATANAGAAHQYQLPLDDPPQQGQEQEQAGADDIDYDDG